MPTAVLPKPSALSALSSDCSAADSTGLDADAAALMADIAAFDIESARQRVQALDARHSGLRVSSTLFPDVPADAAFPPVRVAEAPSAPQPGPQAAPLRAQGGLLDQLKGEVVSRQQEASDASRQVDAEREDLDRRLRGLFEYFHDLTTQLNYLKPAVARSYFFLDSDDAFRNLAWLEGFSDFRTQAEREGGHIERVTLGYTLKGPGARNLERLGSGVERLRQLLFDLGLKFECRERRNRQRELEHGAFTVADEISVLVVWRVDFDNHVIVMESRNLERLGYASCTLSPESIGAAMLDEFGRLMLGRENRFRSFVTR
ncbi:hypothetical protein [Zoogloea sp.]|uniref:hypothetical protein n=1 Tax=Zoogloea sp. TaxID=49181 RepID=UPI002613337E|nr:hypothetical protein [Zoogloea sp.]